MVKVVWTKKSMRTERYEIGAEFIIDYFDRPGQRIGILLAQRMEMQPVQPLQFVRPEIGQGHAQPGMLEARIIQRRLDLGVLRIEAQTASDPFPG